MTGRSSSTKARRRFTDHRPPNPLILKDDHAAVVEGRTLFPTTVVDPVPGTRPLIAGINSRKIGSHVTKGPWRGLPIFTLTLEERKTCPRTCQQWRSCYGNKMHYAKRWNVFHNDFEGSLLTQVAVLHKTHPNGFVVRLHVLGDFATAKYARFWHFLLLNFPTLHVFGYTAYHPSSPKGRAISAMNRVFPDRCAIRFSGIETTVIREEDPVPPDTIVCPAQTNKTDCCGTCGLCWSPAARDKTIAFIEH